MSDIVKVLLLAVTQGVCEFLPISSSGHLVLLQQYLNTSLQSNEILLLHLILHLGTVLATILFFKTDIMVIFKCLFSKKLISTLWHHPSSIQKEETSWLIYLIAISIIPTGLIGLILKQTSLLTPSFLGLAVFFLISAVANQITHRYTFKCKKQGLSFLNMSVKLAIIVGVAQGFAVLPGVSRSGLTIATCLLLGLSQQQSFRFSFLISIPVILLANAVELLQHSIPSYPVYLLIFGFSISFIVGYMALYLLQGLLQRQKFSIFSYYCLLVSVILFLIS